MAALEYSFEGFRVKVAERELWCGDALLSVNRYIFDCIAYLIEHRDRAVGRDELVAAVWGRVEVTDGHLNQIIARARRALDDNAQTQRLIRTVPGFGYRWIRDVEARETKAAEDAAPKPAPSSLHVQAPAPAPSAAPAEPRRPEDDLGRTARPTRRWRYAALVLLVAALGAWAIRSRLDDPATASPRAALVADNAVIVLPFVVEAPSESNWLELGAMDLVGERLRAAGLRVSPSKTVVTALHGTDLSVDAASYARLRNVLGGDLIVQGKATRSDADWLIELAASNAGGVERRVEARGADAIRTARAAADRLLAATGHEPPRDESTAGSDDAIGERLQQAQAATLANELDLARNILLAIRDDPHSLPEVRLRLAELDFRAGQYDRTAEAVETLLNDAAIAPDDVHRGRALILRGNLHFRRSDFAKAVADFDAAVAALDTGAAPLDLCDALTRRGLTRVALDDPDGALSDYGRAYLLAEQSGDRLRVAHIETGFGQLQIVRHRLELALPHLNAAILRYEAFGVVERVVTLRSILIDVYSDLLRWADVLPLAERQWQSRERIGDPGLSLVVFNRQARVLMSVGRYREAGEVIAEAQRRFHELRPGTLRYLHDMQAELASRLGQAEGTVKAVDAALESWPRAPSFDRYAYLVLLRQRALIAQGHAEPERIESWLPEDGDGVSAVFLLAKAEWAAQRKTDLAAVQSAFDRALAKAEDVGLPVLVSLVAQSYVDWLLAHRRRDKAAELAGRVAVWANDDYESALIRTKVFHALGSTDAWRLSLERARTLVGERLIPARLAVPPVAG